MPSTTLAEFEVEKRLKTAKPTKVERLECSLNWSRAICKCSEQTMQMHQTYFLQNYQKSMVKAHKLVQIILS